MCSCPRRPGARERAGREPRLAPALSPDPRISPRQARGAVRPSDGSRVRPSLEGLRGGGRRRGRRRLPGRRRAGDVPGRLDSASSRRRTSCSTCADTRRGGARCRRFAGWPDAVMVILREGPIDWQRFLVHAAQRRFILRMRQMLGYLRQALGVAIPPLGRGRAGLDSRCRCSSASSIASGTASIGCSGSCRPTCSIASAASRTPVLAFPGYLRDAWGLESLGARCHDTR